MYANEWHSKCNRLYMSTSSVEWPHVQEFCALLKREWVVSYMNESVYNTYFKVLVSLYISLVRHIFWWECPHIMCGTFTRTSQPVLKCVVAHMLEGMSIQWYSPNVMANIHIMGGHALFIKIFMTTNPYVAWLRDHMHIFWWIVYIIVYIHMSHMDSEITCTYFDE